MPFYTYTTTVALPLHHYYLRGKDGYFALYLKTFLLSIKNPNISKLFRDQFLRSMASHFLDNNNVHGGVAVALPRTVEEAIASICHRQNQPPLESSTRQELARIGEAAALRILSSVQATRIRISFDGFVKHLIRNDPSPSPTPTPNTVLTPSPYSPPQQRSPFPSPPTTRITRLMMHSQVTTVGDDVQAPPTPPLPMDEAEDMSSSFVVVDREEEEERLSPQMLALGELEFRKAFLILNYIGLRRLRDVFRTDYIRSLKDLPMDQFEEAIWGYLERKRISPDDRRKSLEWESGKSYQYHCHVSGNGSYQFKGPYLEKGRNHLQRVLGDDNILFVKFSNVEDGQTRDDSYAEYNRIAERGILVGLRRYRFFVFKDGGKEARKKDPTSSSVKCLFVRFESNAAIDDGKDYVLSGKTIKEARSVFMHVHTLSSMSKYMARFSLILSKTMKLDIDLSGVNVEEIDDTPCQDKDGNTVYNKDGEPCILTDGTGYISEDLALKCPTNVFKGSVLNSDNVEVGEQQLDFLPILLVREESIAQYLAIISDHIFLNLDGLLGDMKSEKSHHRLLPLLMQFRLFNNGSAAKGTLLVNKKLPPRTIQVRPSMIKVYPDPTISNICTRNSLEIVTTSNQPKKTNLSRYLIALLSYGGVPDDFFMDILKNALEESQAVFSNKRAAVKVAISRGGMDDFIAANMILSGIPLDESFLQYRMSIMLNEERKGLLSGKLPITDSYYLMGTVDPSGVLESDEVSIILEHGQISGKVLVYHQPGLHFGDIHVLNARYVEALNDYVGHAKYAIFFPSKGSRSLADEMAGADYDGDMFFVSRNPQLLKYFKVSEPWIENASTCKASSKAPREFSDAELERELFKAFLRTRFHPSYAMGTAADSWLAMMDRLLILEDSNTGERDFVKKNLLRLIDLYYEALDAPKSGKKVEVPKDLKVDVFPHYMERGNSFKSTSILGKMYDFVKTNAEERTLNVKEVCKLPCFETGISQQCIGKWADLYEEYRKDMTRVLNRNRTKELTQELTEEELKDPNAVYDKYKKIFDESAKSKKKEEIHEEACAVYNVCYNYAMRINDVGRCGFAWRVAGSALLSFYASERDEKLLSCVPSVLKDLL